MRERWRWTLAVALFGILACAIYGQRSEIFTLPDSVLLFSNPPSEIRLVSTTSKQVIKLPTPQGPLSYPALASDGRRLALGLVSSGSKIPRRFVLGVFSLEEQQWKMYGDFESIGVAAFSADKERIAFAAEIPEKKRALVILDISSGTMRTITQMASIPERASLSWSPKGRYLVTEIQMGDKPPVVAVLDSETKKADVIANGVDPVWSPRGDWIAYFNQTRQKCILVHPDGTKARVLRNLGGFPNPYRMFFSGVVWSPDGTCSAPL